MRFRYLLTAGLCLLLFAAPARGATITANTDTGAPSELRTLLEDPNGTGQAYTFAPGVNEVRLDPAKGPVAVGNLNRILQGDGQAMTPTDGIMKSLGELWGGPRRISTYMSGTFAADIDAALATLADDPGRPSILSNGSRAFYWYSNTDIGDTKNPEIQGRGNSFGLSNLTLSSGKVDLGSSAILGGGVLGGYNSLGGSIETDLTYTTNFYRTTYIGNISSAVFQDIEVISSPTVVEDADIAKGGGVIGAAASAATENWTLETAPKVEASTVRAWASVGNISNSLFRDITVSAPDYKLSGGGVIGVMAENTFTHPTYAGAPVRPGPQILDSTASLGEVKGNLFTDIAVTFDKINGGGIVGLSASPALSSDPAVPAITFGDMADNIFTGIDVKATSAIEGGGVVGLKIYSAPATSFTVNSISNSVFNDISITALDTLSPDDGGDLQGGGVIGYTLFSSTQADAGLGALDGLVFNNVSIQTGKLEGGGLMGVSAGAFDNSTTPAATSATAHIDSVNNVYVLGSKVEAFEIQGGGIAGVTAGSNHGPAVATVRNITNSHFMNNSFTTTGYTNIKEPEKDLKGDIFGGIIYSGGGLTVTDSRFVNNTFTAKGTVYGSAIAIDTAFDPDGGAASHSLTLEATSGKSTIIADNTASPSPDMPGVYFGSLKVGEKKVPDPAKPGKTKGVPINLPSRADGVMLVNPVDGNSTVALYNPLSVDMTDSRADDQSQPRYSFGMRKIGNGNFIWGGRNEILLHTSAKKGSVDLAEGTTTLVNNFSLKAPRTDFALRSGANLRLALSPQAYSITADSIRLERGSAIGLSDIAGQRLYSNVLLTLSAPGEIVKKSTLLQEKGRFELGFYDYESYQLEWNGDNLVIGGGNRRENTARGAVAALTAPSAIAANLPGSSDVFRRIRSGLTPELAGPGGFAESPQTMTVSAGDTAPVSPRMWVTPSYNYSSQDSGGRLSGYDISIPSVTAGFDVGSKEALVGIALSGSWPDYDSDDADVDARDITALVYGGVKLPLDLDMALLAGYGYTDYDQTRKVAGQKIDSDYHSKTFTAGAGISRVFPLTGNLLLRPLTSYEYLHIDVSGYGEGEGANNLDVDGFTQSIHRLKAGAELEFATDGGTRGGVTAYYQGMYGDREAATRASFTVDPNRTSLATRGNPLDENSLGLGLFGEIPFTDNVSMSLGYDFLTGKDTQSHQGTVSLKIAF